MTGKSLIYMELLDVQPKEMQQPDGIVFKQETKVL